MSWQDVLRSLIGASPISVVVGLVLLLPKIRSMRATADKEQAEARKVETETTVLAGQIGTEAWETIVRTQAEALVEPLRAEVTNLRTEVAELRQTVETLRSRYWRTVAYIRVLMGHIRRHAPDTEIPPAPAEIAADI